MFKLDAAKEAGYSDEEIADYLAQQKKFNINAARESGYTDTEIADYLTLGRQITAGEAFTRAAERSSTAFVRGGADLLKKFGVDTSQRTPPITTEDYEDPLAWMNGSPLPPEGERASLADPTKKQQTDLEREQEYRIGLRQQTGASIGGIVTGALTDPTNLVAFTAKTITKGALQLGGLGSVTGAVEPVYEEMGDSRLQNIAIGTGLGAVIGGGFGALGARAARKVAEVEAPDVTPPAPKTREEIEAGLPKIETNESLPSLLSKAPEADQKYVDNVLSRYGDDEPLSAPVLKDLADNVESKPLAALFRGAADVAEAADPDKQLTKALTKQADDLNKATVAPSESRVLSTESLDYANRTGDYRDWLTTSAVRLADLRPEQFKRMVDPENPYKGQNIKVLLNQAGEYDEVLEQVLGAIDGRVKYERQTGKTFADINKDAAMIPEEVAVDALVNRKVEELLPPEVLAAGVKATARAIQDLHAGQELARVAKELGSDEAYAVLQAQMSKAASLLASLEGNSSNLGRALAYQKQLKQLVAANRQLPGYLGGIKC
jgi:hypothetical protein